MWTLAKTSSCFKFKMARIQYGDQVTFSIAHKDICIPLET